MKSELPSFVLRNKYTNYYLFIDSEIIKNEIFSERIQSFSKSVGGESISVDVIFPTQYETLNLNVRTKISNLEKDSLGIFYEKLVDLGNNKLAAYMFDFFVYDNTSKWELYCSLGYEIGIFECDKSNVINALNILKPYEKVSLQEKLNSIGSLFTTEKNKDEFIVALLNNFPLKESM